MDTLAAMKLFVRVVEAGSFSAVGREMCMTQSAVSKQIAALEKRIGARLLTRSTRLLALTDDGRQYFESARRLTAEIDEAEAALRNSQAQLTGTLRVASGVAFGRAVLMPHVRSFLAVHPLLRIDLRLNDGFVDLIEQGIDVAARIGQLADSSLVARRIGSSRRALIASRRYLDNVSRSIGVPQTPADLRDHNCIVYTELAERNAWTFTAAPGHRKEASETVLVQGHLHTNSSEVIREAVLSDMGICFSPTWLFAAELHNELVQELLPHRTRAVLPVQLVSPLHCASSTKVKTFAEHLRSCMPEKGRS
jgi:DNA-binding transcriptional LysR family regulator